MNVHHGERRIEPSAEILTAARKWVDRMRPALGSELLAAYLTGSVLTQGFDPKKSRVNILVVLRQINGDMLEAIAKAMPRPKTGIRFEPMFMTRRNIENTLDSFAIEWLEIQERHLRLEGEDLFTGLTIQRNYLRVQCEHELRAKHLQLRQAYFANYEHPTGLKRVLAGAASGFAAMFRTLLRLATETPPADNVRVIERVADRFGLDAQALLGAHLVRYGGRRYTAKEITTLYLRFLDQMERLVTAIDQLPVS